MKELENVFYGINASIGRIAAIETVLYLFSDRVDAFVWMID